MKEDLKKEPRQPSNPRSFSKAKDNSDDEATYEEPKEQMVIPHFLKNLPGVSATDSMGYRIEALRVYLENQLGDIPFIAGYKHLVVINYF